MNINIGDSLIFLSQGFQGSIASGIYPVLGIVDLKTPDLNRRTVIMNLGNAQDFFGIDNMATSAVIGPKNDEWGKSRKKYSNSTRQLSI